MSLAQEFGVPDKVALLSVFDKTGIENFARSLQTLGWQLWASGGTATTLESAGIRVTNVTDIVGPPMFGHRVATLAREIYGAILARPDNKDDLAELHRLGLPIIDLVCVDLYPLKEEVDNPEATEQTVIEKTDIGGPTLLRAAAKARRLVISKPPQREEVLDWLAAGEPDPKAFRRKLAARAERVVADYVTASALYLESLTH